MKREIAKKCLNDEFTNNDKIVDRIFDDFESRTCENCKYYHQNYLCLEVGNGDFEPDKYFGCNKFISKLL